MEYDAGVVSLSHTHENRVQPADLPRPHLLPPSSRGRATFARWAPAVIALVVILGVGLLPVDKIPSTCLMRRTFGIGCPTCGMTRALHALLHADVALSWRYHPLLIVYLLTGGVWQGLRRWRRSRGHGEIPALWMWLAAIAALALLIGVWVFRLLAGTAP